MRWKLLYLERAIAPASFIGACVSMLGERSGALQCDHHSETSGYAMTAMWLVMTLAHLKPWFRK